MAYPDLRSFLADLGDDLLHVRDEFDPQFEIAAVLRSLPADAPAALFENVRGYPGARVAGNLFGARRRVARAFGTTEDRLAQAWLANKQRAIAPVVAKSAPVQEVVHESPDDLLSLLPVLTHHEKDGGPFITTGVVLCTDPATGRRGMGIHRLMVKGGRRLGVLLANPPLSQFHANAESLGRPLDVAIALGLEPATLLASVVRSGPQGPDKMAVAGGLRGEPVELVRARSVEVEVPARAEIVIEGRILPGVRESEGPFGENTGYYFTNVSPVIEISAVTHRDNFIYPGLCPWSGDVDTLLSLAAGTELLGQLQTMVAGVVDLDLTSGTAGFSAAIAVKGCPRHEARRLVMLALNLDKRLKTVTVVDDDVDIRNPREVAWAMATRYLPERDTVILGGAEGYVIDPSSAGSSAGSKAGFIATRGAGPEFDRITLPAAALAKAQALLATLHK
ncbi:UbiD family decarboxylase [Aromatoleum anaerobium]|uniref:UbiD family decarboxylase n=1 Tax=Aromatoleum anaerobium TaxID=182180 RepID=A0ABX1PMB6_9RHOO|nr:UbiD family decarboxylase [Aromatoleum anaerobium]MCK0506104.1 UbiD family decarboxylase [Aromatoleum anaerobium]